MLNHEMVIQSTEKHESHKRINAFFVPWIEFYFGKGATIATLPAQSGIQETFLLDYIEHLESCKNKHSQIKFLTFDCELSAKETNIALHHHGRVWQHHVADVFSGLLKYSKLGNHAVWFDLTGGLSDKNLNGVTSCVDKLFKPGSLLFMTFQIHAVRCLSGNETLQTYHSTANTPLGNVIHTERLIENAVRRETGKSLQKLMPTYTYRRDESPTTFAVFGYIVI